MKYIPILTTENTKPEDKLYQFKSTLPLSVYIHFPWCIQKCPYCDFNSHAIKTKSIPEEDYLKALILDLQHQLPLIWGRSVQSIFIGGGTPSLISANGMHFLMNQLRTILNIEPDAEITLEVNPGTLDRKNFMAYFDAGINRLSIGVQSLNDQHLLSLGRIHTANEALATISNALEIFPRVNADLMYALPSQKLEEVITDIVQLIQTGVNHISAYQLTLEPNTWFYHHPPILPSEDHISDIEDKLYQLLADSGFQRYEISAFAKPKQQSQHNLNYWQFGDYLGIGAGAHGKITSSNNVIRTNQNKQPQKYLELIHNAKETSYQTRIIAIKDLPAEFMLNALRLINGFSPDLFEYRTALPLLTISEQLDEAQHKGLLLQNTQLIKPTNLGFKFLNNLIEIFL